MGYRVRFSLVWILALPLMSCVTLVNLLNLSESQISHLYNGEFSCIYFIGLVWVGSEDWEGNTCQVLRKMLPAIVFIKRTIHVFIDENTK